jgi:hypothetical protein
MARIRTVKPEFFSDPDLGRLSLPARHLYLATWCFADDEGRLPADARLMKSQAFPYDDSLTVRKVERLIAELVELHKAVPYTVAGIDYLLLTNFRRHQKINRPQPAKYPAPPDVFSEDSVTDPGADTEDSPPLSDTTLPDSYPPKSPAERGTNPRSQGTNPRAVAARAKAEKLRSELEDCPECGTASWNCTRCSHRLRELEAVAS